MGLVGEARRKYLPDFHKPPHGWVVAHSRFQCTTGLVQLALAGVNHGQIVMKTRAALGSPRSAGERRRRFLSAVVVGQRDSAQKAHLWVA